MKKPPDGWSDMLLLFPCRRCHHPEPLEPRQAEGYHQLEKSDPAARRRVELMFDQTYGVVGLKPAGPEAHNALPVVPAVDGYYRRTNAASFCRHFNITVEKTMLFVEPTLESDGVMELNLTKAMTVTRRAR